MVAPRSLAALVEPVARLIESVRVGEHTQIIRQAPGTVSEVDAIFEGRRHQLASGESWYLDTPYGGFGGEVPAGEPATVSRVSRRDELLALTKRLEIPTRLHRGEPVRFDHAFVTRVAHIGRPPGSAGGSPIRSGRRRRPAPAPPASPAP